MAYVDIQNGDDSDDILLKLNKGLALADKSVTSVDTMQELCDLPTDLHLNATISGFHSADGGGGGPFHWDASRSKTEHNGGTIVDPLKGDQLGDSWPGTWFTPNVSGIGCWVRGYTGKVKSAVFGVKADGVDDSLALAATILINGSIEIDTVGDIKTTTPLELSSSGDVSGSNKTVLLTDDGIGLGRGIIESVGVDKTVLRNFAAKLESVSTALCAVLLDDSNHSSLVNLYIDSDLAGAYPVLLSSSASNSIFSLNHFSAPGSVILAKPTITGVEGTDFIDDLIILGNQVTGSTAAVTNGIGISLDLGVRRCVVLGNAVSGMAASGSQGFAIAIAGGNLSSPEATGILVVANVATDSEREGIHIENYTKGVTVALNVVEAAGEEGIVLQSGSDAQGGNENQIVALNQILEPGGAGIAWIQSGSTTKAVMDSVMIGNIIESPGGDGIQLYGAGISDRWVCSHNVVLNAGDVGIDVQNQPPTGAVISHNIVKGAATYGLQGRTTSSNKKVLVESNNLLEGTSGAVNTGQVSNLMGDQVSHSGSIVANVASSNLMFVAQRAGVITEISYTMLSAPTGTDDALSITINGSADILSAKSVDTSAKAQYTTTLYASPISRSFNAGDVIEVVNTGVSTGAARYSVNIEFFYYLG